MNMKKFHITIISLAAALSAAAAPRDTLTIESGLDTISLGYGIEVSDKSSAFVHRGVGRSVIEKSPDIDAAKALYGQIAGLNVYQGSGTTYDNIAPPLDSREDTSHPCGRLSERQPQGYHHH